MVATAETPRRRSLGARILLHRVPAHQWVRSPLWDAFWMFASIWGSALLVLSSSAVGWRTAAAALFAGNAILATLHAYSTTFMVLGSTRLREARARHRFRLVVAPLSLAALGLGVGVYAGLTLSFPRDSRFGWELWPWLLYLALYWVGHFWHFGRQDFGVLSIYRTRAGQTDAGARRLDQVHATAMMMVIQPIMYLSAVAWSPLGEAFYSLVPVSAAFMAQLAHLAVMTACALTAYVVGVELARPNRSVPKLAYYAVMLSHPVIIGAFAGSPWTLLYTTTYLWSHWFVAIGLVSHINSSHYRQLGCAPVVATARHWLMIGVIAAVVYFAFTDVRSFTIFSRMDYRDQLAGVTPEQGLVVGLMLGAALAEQLAHYCCDRSLFRLRDPDIRKAIGSLL